MHSVMPRRLILPPRPRDRFSRGSRLDSGSAGEERVADGAVPDTGLPAGDFPRTAGRLPGVRGMSPSPDTDGRFDELLALQRSLLQATAAWARGTEPGPEVAEQRRAAIGLLHLRYVQLIPL